MRREDLCGSRSRAACGIADDSPCVIISTVGNERTARVIDARRYGLDKIGRIATALAVEGCDCAGHIDAGRRATDVLHCDGNAVLTLYEERRI